MHRVNVRLLIGLVVAVALAWGGSPDVRAAAKATAKAAATKVATTKATARTASAAKAAPATTATAAAQKSKNQTGTACTINGKTVNPCPPAILKQLKRQAARKNAAPQKKGVAVQFAGVSTANATTSPLMLAGAGPTTLAAMAPAGTPPDYFGVGNYANSPLPQVASGVITAGTGLRKFVDTLPLFCASGTTGGNGLGQCLPVAVPDTTSFPGSDFYRIAAKEFTQQMHSDLPGPFNPWGNTASPGTKLRGYVQLDSTNAIPSGAKQQYLGPFIIATRNRPVRFLFNNQLSTNLDVPTDWTYMGAGQITDSQNHSVAKSTETRSVIHLHGGNSPWISDGTPHQWITPATDPQAVANPYPGFAKGFSFQNVPDMVALPNLFPNGVSPNDGLGTYYYTNQQSGRLMFYHEHAYGTTRLGVYNGLAAGYLLVDGTQESMLRQGTAPGTILTKNDGTNLDIFGNPSQIVDTASADLAHVIPLVIQDKTFVPDNGVTGGQLAAQDPTWDVANWGGAGDLWFPHVYMPNQNPADTTGANGFGRWDWGPWFWPPQNPGSLAAQAWPCTSAAYPTGQGSLGPLMCPGVPFVGASAVPAAAAAGVPDSPSGTPESFMDTPVVNGTAYPTLSLTPSAYRFQVLNAANDRSLNLGLYIAEPYTVSPVIVSAGSNYTAPVLTFGNCTDGIVNAQLGSGVDPNTLLPFTNGIVGINIVVQPTLCSAAPTINITDTTGTGATVNAVVSSLTDVRMVPAISASSGRTAVFPNLPNCGQQNPMAGGGQISALLDGAGNPLNGTGLPANCWPLYSNAQGFSAAPMGENGNLSWANSDGRTGGVPDPTWAGPPIIQIGAEGGVLPQLAVIPSTPVSFDYNKRSITVLNVLNHGLWLGPAERADLIVDLSNAPAMCAAKGISPCTLILYNDAPAPVPAGDPRIDYYTNDPDQSSSGGAPSTLAGYGPNMRTIMQIQVTGSNTNLQAFSLATLTPIIPQIFATTQDAVIVPETVYPAANGGAAQDTYIPIQANSINAWVGAGVGNVQLAPPGGGGSGYTSVPSVVIAPPTTPGGSTATASATLAPAAVAAVNPVNLGFGYTTAPAVTISGGGGASAAATAVLGSAGVRRITVNSGGGGYSSTTVKVLIGAPPIGGTQATATATIGNNGRVTAINVTNPGSGYTSVPSVTVTGGTTAASATASLGYRVTGYNLVSGGSGYTSAPSVSVAAVSTSNCSPTSICSSATAQAVLAGRVVASVTLINPGSGYTAAPAVTIAAPPAGGTQATAIATAPSVPLVPKTIQELFTLDYGRMNATLGVELPFTNFLTQTTIPYGYVDPPTEIFKDGETQLWKITHNGVDTHFIHFHLFTVQVINRVGWDGAIKPPDPYELGLKDTVRMNPLEDIIVALRPYSQKLPFAVPNSARPMDVTHPVGYTSTTTFTNVDPTNQPANVTNDVINFGWEYVWHCHILGHEENDMMRPMVFAVAPQAPSSVAAVSGPKKGQITLTMQALTGQVGFGDPTGFTIQRSTSASGPWTTIGSVSATIANGIASASFTDTGLTSKARYYYQVVSSNVVGDTAAYAAPAAGYPHVSADSKTATAASAIAQ